MLVAARRFEELKVVADDATPAAIGAVDRRPRLPQDAVAADLAAADLASQDEDAFGFVADPPVQSPTAELSGDFSFVPTAADGARGS